MSISDALYIAVYVYMTKIKKKFQKEKLKQKAPVFFHLKVNRDAI